MKTVKITLICLISVNLMAQEIQEREVTSKVNEVTVFMKKAQATRKKTLELTQGQSLLKFTNLSPFIDAKTVQVKANGNVTIQAVNYQRNYLKKLDKPAELITLESKLEEINEKIDLQNTYLTILKEELTFLQENRIIGGKNEQTDIANLIEASKFYHERLNEIKFKQIEHLKNIKLLDQQKNDVKKQIQAFTNKKEYAMGEVLVKVNTKKSGRVTFELSYVVDNVSWYPSYDIRVNNINEPVQIIYKANIRQDTKVDWKNVKLHFSSADPNESGVKPNLPVYYLNYYSRPLIYKENINSIRGRITDVKNEPLPGVSIIVPGTTIGTVTDYDGNYSITLPENTKNINYSYLGYKTQTLPVHNEVMNVRLEEDLISLDEVVVVGYGSIKKSDATGALQGKMAGIDAKREKIKIRGTTSNIVETVTQNKFTTVDFDIKEPYSIQSNNQNLTIDMEVYEIPAFYQYYSIPKITKDAFLIANATDWEKYNFLEGEANIFFEDTYVGKTILDVSNANDTLQISLGRDKNVVINREKIKDFTSKKFIGSNKEEVRAWNISVKNNKTQPVNMIILDQVPVSTLEEIVVNVQNISGAKYNNENGEVKWDFSLRPGDNKDYELKYSVKYPKNKNLIID